MPTAVDPATRDAERAGTELTTLDFELGRSEYTNDHTQGNDIRDARLGVGMLKNLQQFAKADASSRKPLSHYISPQ
jgi:hypothetical protein